MPLIRKGAPVVAKPDADDEPFEALTKGSLDERWQAARDIGGRVGGVEALSRALARETDPRVREAILTSLAHVATAESIAVILPYVRADDAAARTAALDALRASPGAAEPNLAALLHDPDPDVRLLICEVVRELPASVATRLMADLLDREPEVNVCGAAVEVLAEIGEPEAAPALDRCAARFANESFLIFAIRVAMQRISAQSAARG
jgi:HEAT repeat protein